MLDRKKSSYKGEGGRESLVLLVLTRMVKAAL